VPSYLFIGSIQSGKKSLLKATFGKHLKAIETAQKLVAVDFSAYDVVDDNEVLGRMGMYMISREFKDLMGQKWLVPSLDACIIVLDWQKPEEFINELKFWLEALENCISAQSGKDDLVDRQNALRQLWSHAGESDASKETSPGELLQGAMTRNIGMKLFILCHKSDAVHSLEKDGVLDEEKSDQIQQLLRTLCLQYGASLLYTNTFKPENTEKLHHYLLYSLFNIKPQDMETAFKPNVVEKDLLFVPFGWDSWGKINVLRSFDCKRFQLGQYPDVANWASVADFYAEVFKNRKHNTNEHGKENFPVIQAEDEQQFLEKQHQILVSIGGVSNINQSASKEVLAGVGTASSTSTSPVPPSAQSQDGSQNQVLASFFQSLLNKKGGASGTSPSSVKRGAVEAELDKMRSK
jgi:dynein light intermediate chain 1